MPLATFQQDDRLGEIVIDSPPLNLFSADLLADLRAAADQAAHSDVRALLLRAEGDDFSAGADVSIFVRLTEGNGVYHLELQLQTLEGDIVWRDGLEPALEVRDPLAIGLLDLQHRRIYVPKRRAATL